METESVHLRKSIWNMRTEAEVICTDESWNARTGEVRYSEIYMGETIDTTIGRDSDRADTACVGSACESSVCADSGVRTGTVSAMEFDKQHVDRAGK